jgi:26S proteasome regulatory subunit N2
MATLLAMPLSASSFGGDNASASASTSITTTTPIATASGLLALLSESDPTLVKHALTRLLSVVDTLWHEVAESLPELEAIAEGSSIKGGDDTTDMMMEDTSANENSKQYDIQTRQIAAALASRVFFHLEEPHQALRLALESGDIYFNVLTPPVGDVLYVERLVNTAIGEYVKRKQIDFMNSEEESSSTTKKKGGKVDDVNNNNNDNDDDDEPLDMTKLTKVVQLMFQRCYNNGSYVHALGVAFESCESSRVQEILHELLNSSSSLLDIVNILSHAMNIAQSLISSKIFRSKALSMIASSLDTIFTSSDLASSEGDKRHAACALVLCYQLLNDALSVGKIITHLIDNSSSSSNDDSNGGSNDDSALLGLQLCFDIVDSGDQKFVATVASCLPTKEESTVMDTATAAATANEHGVEVVNESTTATLLLSPPAMADELGVEVEEGGGRIVRSDATWKHFTNATRVLTGGFTSELSLSFLFKNSNADTLIMSNLKKSLEERSMSRNSVLHNCAVTTHGYMNAGTTNDDFLRDNLDWMKKASNW